MDENQRGVGSPSPRIRGDSPPGLLADAIGAEPLWGGAKRRLVQAKRSPHGATKLDAQANKAWIGGYDDLDKRIGCF